MRRSLIALCLNVFIHHAATNADSWCYTGCEHTPDHWQDLDGSFCGGQRQSPVNILSGHVERDATLGSFSFVNFSSRNAFRAIVNTGHTAKFLLKDNEVELSGGGLNGTYSTIQLHFHWGDTEHHPGSEHAIDGHRHPMEMHIVSLKKGLSVAQALEDSAGIAVLGFFIRATEDENLSNPWSALTSYLLKNTGTEVNVTHAISIDDLIGDVNLTKYFRYMGSLTTPSCHQVVAWTVFQEPISVNKILLQQFPLKTGLTNVYRPVQDLHGRQVFSSAALLLPPSHVWCYDDNCEFSPAKWHLLPNSHCDGERQSPVNIEAKKAVKDERLDGFAFTKFDDKHVIEYITNTGHTVKFVLKEGAMEVSGGGLGHVYSALQFHFHWGSSNPNSEGSEHTLDSKRFPMEVHIVNKRKDLTLEEAVNTTTGLAVLGFFIEAATIPKSRDAAEQHEDSHDSPDDSSDESMTGSWKALSSYLAEIQSIGSRVEVTEELSLAGLLGDVDLASYYRYNGSLTTPSCNEAVIWTVFKDSIKVDRSLLTTFPNRSGFGDVFRPPQSLRGREIYTTATGGALAPAIFFLALVQLCGFLL
ncbi:carbonic anhydrase 4-like [Hippocampus comes]|uniref:Carbonic anhydrase n=1 Tax=Hippocampus comes TaxID=109280 RepID=A0A3Q2YCG8_HIPCM|nr:PREDICTED: carbonic anhydrase 4-like [Hippocampus comes]XP_019739068.1 PREDICTED: carbonic anhydrase 4-like [Hippocampus comes]XP_019739070.1 PREDICTED: carbonic anhydrase 4-like [Hippocampus comes]